jgi:hypothetical protein
VSVLQKSRVTGADLTDGETPLFIDYYLLFTASDIAVTLTLTDVYSITNNSTISYALLGLRKATGISQSAERLATG